MGMAVAAFSVAAALIVLVPGPDTLVVLRSLIRGGRGSAARTATGVICGQIVWIAAAAFGLSALLRASHAGFVALKLVGAAYLIWLGVQSIRARRLAPDDHTRRPLFGSGFFAGMASDVLNPKVGVFFVTFLPAFVPAGVSVGATTVLFGVIFSIETAVFFALLLAAATRLTRWMAKSRLRRRLDMGTGVVLIGLGVRLAVEP